MIKNSAALFLLFLLISVQAVNAQRFVVLMKESFEQSVKKTGQDNPNRLRKAQDNEQRRNQKMDKVNGFARNKGINVPRGKAFVDGAVGFVANLSMGQVNELRNDPAVEGVFPDFTIQSTRPRMQSRPRMQGESIDEAEFYDVNSKSSCAIPLIGGSQTSRSNSSIWVIDSGVDASHIDLNVNSNPLLSVSFVESEINPLVDQIGHGTHCAGLAAGKGSGNPGVTGVSAGAEIISVKILDNQGIGTWSQLILALDHVAKYGVKGDVVLMSLGGGDECSNDPILRDLITSLGDDRIFVVMSAGNDGMMSSQNLPGCIDGQNIVTVGALDFTCDGLGGLAGYSNIGIPSIDFVAPGSNMISAFPNNQYQVMSGTSMAAAVVAGLVHSRGNLPRSIGSLPVNGFTYPVAGR
ncbi:MAG: S8 family serine peptidase [Cyclobacteriaceae bacterium]|nr:S8 family serine peptidase [Cyclobacteriaceae bacterium]MDX5467007.1 S8 family serine peptidase [Cyclobacteriaceae bacterium]